MVMVVMVMGISREIIKKLILKVMDTDMVVTVTDI